MLVDEHGCELLTRAGRVRTMSKEQAHSRGVRHRAVSVFVFNRKGELLLQRRAEDKYHSGGLWSNTCCTHPQPGEAPLHAARRRLAEEMGIECQLRELLRFSYTADVGNGLTENEYDHAFVGMSDATPRLNGEEASDWRWEDPAQLEADLAACPESFSVWLRECFLKVMKERHRSGNS
ncbi:MAG: isopentenyl-diphosphate Delta-isomerase [Chloroflexi bacterium]|nr:isopentenyl-diphosphate Delta-isomerase [Chloroflexota bacterium]